MRVRWFLAAFTAVLIALAVVLWRYTGETRATVLERDHAANFERIFDAVAGEDVTIVHSIVVEYEWRIGTVTTDDWEIEVVAPRAWIEEQIDDMHLAPLKSDTWVERHVKDRRANRFRDWYAPGPFESYDVYYLRATSIPYVHMLVQKEPEPDGRAHAFISKH